MESIGNPAERLVPPESLTIPGLFEARTRRSPEATFLTWEGRTWTYGEAWKLIRRVSGWLLSDSGSEVDPPGRVASFLPNCPEAVWAWLGTAVAGLAYVPLNRAHRGEILADMLTRSGASVLVTDREGLACLPDPAECGVRRLVLVDGVGSDSPAGAIDWRDAQAGEPAVGPPPGPGDLAGLLYTSGTTGRSKAVLLTHGQLCRGAGWVVWSLELGASDVLHAWLPLFHVAGMVDSVLPMVIAGGKVALFPTFSRRRFWDQVSGSGATVFIGFSNVVEILWAAAEGEGERIESTLRAGIMGKIPVELHRRFEQRFEVRLHDVYGMTEIEPLALPYPGEEYPVGSCGRQRPDLELAILGSHGERLPAGQEGEIACRPLVPDALTPGYEGDDAATVRATEGLWFRTGDIGRIDEDGFVYFVDRRKHVIRRRGENISSWELEGVIAKHPAVAECCALAVPSPLGEDDVKIVVSPQPGMSIDPARLREWCDGRMARFMFPRYIQVLDALPRAPTGKVLKEELRGAEGCWDAEREEGRAPLDSRA